MSEHIIKVMYLGVVSVRHISGICETDKGERFVGNNDTQVGDVLISIDGFKRFVKAKEYAEKYRKYCDNDEIKYKRGVTKALLKTAQELGIEVTAETTKEELVLAIKEASEDGSDLGDDLTQGGDDA